MVNEIIRFEDAVRALSQKKLVNFLIDAAENSTSDNVSNYVMGAIVNNTGQYKEGTVVQCDVMFIHTLESAITWLQLGDIHTFNKFAAMIGVPALPEPSEKLPHIPIINREEALTKFREYAETLN